MHTVCVVGAGLAGAVLAHEVASAGVKCDVFEARSVVGGNCRTERDDLTGVMVHVYGPHIFHTNDERIWNYVCQLDEFVAFTNRVKAIANNHVYSLPINLQTINQFFGRVLSPDEARQFLSSIGDKRIVAPKNFEEQALRLMGRDLYEAFFKGYSTKQWGIDPSELPASVLQRLPMRFNYDDNYFNSKYQGIPKNGYTSVIQKLLDHKNISLSLNVKFSRKDSRLYEHTFYTGPLDEWFSYRYGSLGYRTLNFVMERHDGDYQGNAVINYCDPEVAWTRICEHKHFAPWESHGRTVIYKEYSRDWDVGDVPCYPIRLASEEKKLQSYIAMAKEESSVTFVGRLATYQYLDMDTTISKALSASEQYRISLGR